MNFPILSAAGSEIIERDQQPARILPGGIKICFVLIILILPAGCIDPFTPRIGETGDIVVINGRITDREGYQCVQVTRTSPLYNEEGIRPVSNCRVEVEDDRGNVHEFTYSENGIYGAWMDSMDLGPGTRYKLTVIAPWGRSYESTFEELLPCPPIEEISWEIRETRTDNPNISYNGVQFYISTDATGDYARNYLWELEETWKYFAPYDRVDKYDFIPNDSLNRAGIIRGDQAHPDTHLVTCFKTRAIPQIYTYSTRNISGEYIQNIPLNYVSDQTDRLYERYSLLARQYSLSDGAYAFWKILEGQAKQEGELYETQPVRIRGNITCIEDPGEKVLGYFYAAALTEKRIFIWPRIQTYLTRCNRYGFTQEELMAFLSDIPPEEYPVWLWRVYFNQEVYDYVDQICYNCMLKGGDTVVPPFWVDKMPD